MKRPFKAEAIKGVAPHRRKKERGGRGGNSQRACSSDCPGGRTEKGYSRKGGESKEGGGGKKKGVIPRDSERQGRRAGMGVLRIRARCWGIQSQRSSAQ